MLDKLKSLFKRKPKPKCWRNLSKDEQDSLIEELIVRLDSLEEDNELLKRELGELSAYCDKCDGNTLQYCLKCNGTGIVKKSRLLDWPWQ